MRSEITRQQSLPRRRATNTSTANTPSVPTSVNLVPSAATQSQSTTATTTATATTGKAQRKPRVVAASTTATTRTTAKPSPATTTTTPLHRRGVLTAATASERSAQAIASARQLDVKLVETILTNLMDSAPGVQWEDIAGLNGAKSALDEIVVMPALRPDLFQGLRAPPRGLLLFGPPGNGKTMLAKALASAARATFFNISASALVSKWMGEGEKLVRTLFAVAAHLQPSVVFIDEIDSMLTARSSGEHEASRRLKTEFLVQMDGVQSDTSERILLLGATNKQDELDEAALRRFPKRIYVPLPDVEGRASLITHLLKKQHALSDRDMTHLASATEGFSGSDLKALCTEAAMEPIRELGRAAMTADAKSIPLISVKHFQAAMTRIRPSTSRETILKYEAWNAKFGSIG
eukprot:TRINITY_DN1873_c0_g3_i4.p1 TRINITY_DN1873_c0_g3~~TRINITY_DN1873_c0_g3_i4.p1  ORF type:complete len:407 (+),score=103.09 TRINITY_DN1873_c0_g3_i4:652-1872(+)